MYQLFKPLISMLISISLLINNDGFAVFHPEYHWLIIISKIVTITHLTTYIELTSVTDIAHFSTDISTNTNTSKIHMWPLVTYSYYFEIVSTVSFLVSRTGLS